MDIPQNNLSFFDAQGNLKKFGNICWLTTFKDSHRIPIPLRTAIENLQANEPFRKRLVRSYGEIRYEPYNNYDGIDVPRALLARHIEHALLLPRDSRAGRKRQARLADARIADDQHHRARDHATAEHAVELGRPRRKAWHVLRDDIADRLRRLRIAEPEPYAAEPFRLFGDDLLDQRIPRTAPRAFPEPLHRIITALLADIMRLFFLPSDSSHQSSLFHQGIFHQLIDGDMFLFCRHSHTAMQFWRDTNRKCP